MRGVISVPGDWYGDPKWTILDKAWRTFPEIEQLSDDFVYMNDDFYFLERMTSIPVRYKSNLTDAVPISNYQMGKQMVKDWLVRHGFGIRNYEMHLPMVLNKGCVSNMYHNWGVVPIYGFQRSLYGNMYAISGDITPDCKIRDGEMDETAALLDPTDCFLSSDTISWLRRPEFIRVRDMYATPSKWET